MELLNPSNRTLIEVAKKAGISERTLRYWQNLPHFQERLQQERKKLQDQGIDNLIATFNIAVLTMRSSLIDKDSSIRLRAAQAIVDYIFKLMDRDKENKPQHPYDEDDNAVSRRKEGGRRLSIQELFQRLPQVTAANIAKMREEDEAKEREKRSGNEIKIKDP